MSTATNGLHALCIADDLEGLLKALKSPSLTAAVNDRDQANKCPLHYVCQTGNIAAAEALITCGADVNAKLVSANVAQATSSDSLLHIAVRHGHYPLVARLVELGANYYATDANGDDVLHTLLNIVLLTPTATNVANKTQQQTEAFQLIGNLVLKHSASINTKNRGGKSLLHRAAEVGATAAMSQLFEVESACRSTISGEGNVKQGSDEARQASSRRLALCTIDVNSINIAGEGILLSAL
eukprot:PhF_6_TR35158/c0_g2_i1/m.51228